MISTKLIVYLRRKSSPTVARDYGYTKNHFLVEAFMGGRWRLVGFYTAHQVYLGKCEKKVKHMMKRQLDQVPDSIIWMEDVA